MSRVGVYISVIIVICHSIRLVPNTWELLQRQTMVNEVSCRISVADPYQSQNKITERICFNVNQFCLALRLAAMGGHHHYGFQPR